VVAQGLPVRMASKLLGVSASSYLRLLRQQESTNGNHSAATMGGAL